MSYFKKLNCPYLLLVSFILILSCKGYRITDSKSLNIDTENNIGRNRLKLMGFDFDSDFYLFIDNEYLSLINQTIKGF